MMITKSTHQKLMRDEVARLQKEFSESIKELSDENLFLSGKLKSLLEVNKKTSKNSHLIVEFNEDLSAMLPKTVINQEQMKYLVEKSYIPYNKQSDEAACQLGLLLYASDALNELISQFESDEESVEQEQ